MSYLHFDKILMVNLEESLSAKIPQDSYGQS